MTRGASETTPERRLDALLRAHAPDPRTALAEVTLERGALVGVAQPSLAGALGTFAAEHRLGLEVAFPTPEATRVAVSRLALRAAPDDGAVRVSEALCGEPLTLFDRRGAHARAATGRDGYLGWVRLDGLRPDASGVGHRFVAPRGHAFAAPEVAAPPRLELAFGALLGLARAPASDGWSAVTLPAGETAFVRSALLRPQHAPPPAADPDALVAFAHRFLEAPYLWGGVSAWGLDCSGLVQTVFGAFGLALPRDSDQQAALGAEVAADEAAPGDLLFFPGHVALSLGGGRLLHANAHHMRVTVDDLAAEGYGRRLRERLTGARRLL